MSDDLSRAMRATAENLTPNIGKLTAGGVERGVRKRRARRISQIAGAAASVTAVFGVVAVVGTAGSGSTPASAATGSVPGAVAATSPAVASTPTATSATSSGDSEHRKGTPPKAAPSAPPVSGEDMAKWLKEQAAPLGFSNVTVLNKAGSAVMGGPYAVLKVDFAAGQGDVSVSLENQAWENVHYGSPLPANTTIKDLPDGSHLVIYNGLQSPAGNGDPTAKRLDASWYRTDGVMVNIEAINEVVEKGTTTAGAVPLTPEQAETIARSSVWDKAVAAKAYQGWLDYQAAVGGNKDGSWKTDDPKAKAGAANGAATPAPTSAR